jgi:ferric-dicitrate binding protein FerR (iron transport regulator)
MKSSARLDWLARYADGSATADQVARLEAEIRRDPEFRQLVVEYLHLDASLADAVNHLAPATRATPLAFPPQTRRRFAALTSLAAAAALVASIGFWTFRSPAAASEVSIDVLEADCFPARSLGRQGLAGDLRLDSGSIRFRLDTGAIVEAVAPADFSIPDPMRLKLRRGNVTADAGERSHGFVIETASARVVHQGQRFGVAVGDDGLTDVVAIDGGVDVFEPLRASAPARHMASLKDGDAIRVDRARKANRLKTVSLRNDALVPNGKHRSTVIGEISDNFDEPGFLRCYAIVPRALRPNARLHTDKPGIRWQESADHPFPAALKNADVIRTFFHDRRDLDLRLTITLEKPATVFIFHDARKPPPRWLREDFTRTSDTLVSGPWRRAKGEATYTLDYQVWRRACPAGEVVLGPSQDPGSGPRGVMYGIAVKARRP